MRVDEPAKDTKSATEPSVTPPEMPNVSVAPYNPPKVSRKYRYDWQYAVDASRLPFLREASLIIAVMPLILAATREALQRYSISIHVPTSIWLTWMAAVVFIISWAILNARCPLFLREYRDYGEYLKRHHSHRWIVWEFYNTIESFQAWRTIVRETLEKGVSIEFDGSHLPEGLELSQSFWQAAEGTEVKLFEPKNFNRDICLPIYYYGKRLLLVLQEQDPKLKEKEKELFWILYSQAAKEQLKSRILFWITIYFAGALLATGVIVDVVEVLERMRSHV